MDVESFIFVQGVIVGAIVYLLWRLSRSIKKFEERILKRIEDLSARRDGADDRLDRRVDKTFNLLDGIEERIGRRIDRIGDRLDRHLEGHKK